MFIYFLPFIIALIYYIATQKTNYHSDKLLAFYFLYLALFVGFGDMIGGYDRYIYGEVFDTISDAVQGKGGKLSDTFYLIGGNEYGYYLWQVFIGFFTRNRYIFILITTIMMYSLYFFTFRQYINNYPLACIVFLGLFYYFTMTYLRQVIAVGIAWQGVKYIWERKPKQFFSIMLLAYSFHNSVMIFMPMYFLPIKKYNINSVVLIMFICLLIGLTPFPGLLMSGVGDATGMEERTSAYTEDQMAGFRFEYLLEAFVFCSILFANYRFIPKTKKTLTFLNMSFVFCAVLLVFIRFGQGGRFGWYYFFGLIYMLSMLADNHFRIPWMKYFVIILCFGLFTRVSFAWSKLILPYKTFLTDGIPSSPYMYENNEYDVNYTLDKFYR